MRTLRLLVRLFLFVIAFVLLTIGLVWAFGDPHLPRVAHMADLRKGRVLHFEDLEIFLVLHDGKVYALADHYLDQNSKQIDAIYCDKSRLFEATSGAKFDRIGRYYGGPAPRGLPRYPVEVEEGDVLVDLSEPQPGPPRGSGSYEPTGAFCLV